MKLLRNLALASVLALTFLAPAFGNAQLQRLSYGQLAGLKSSEALQTLVAELDKLNEESLPHEAKTLRKQIGTLRDQIDLFSYAFPAGSRQDGFLKLRKDLDEGYEHVGLFKDLYDIQSVERPEDAAYDKKELKKRRKAALEWKEHFLKADVLQAYGSFLSKPDLARVHVRPKKDLSRFYWGSVDLHPDTRLTGLQNLSRLTSELLTRSAEDNREALELKHLTDEENAVSFHDFRKRVRSIVKILANYPEVLKAPASTQSAVTLLTELVDRYGEINDRIVAHEEAKRASKNRRAEELAEEITSLWKETKAWQRTLGVPQLLEQLGRNLVR